MRCFISIELPDNVRSKIFEAFGKLKKSKTCFGNFVKKENLHLTLKFLGDIPQEKTEGIKKALEKIDFRQFPVETGEIGFFPNEKYIKAVWIDLLASDFDFLKDEIDEELSKLGLSQEEREFKTHVTAVRIKSIPDKKAFFEKVHEIAPKKMFFIVDSFSLIKSDLKMNGPRYELLKEFGMRMR